LTSALTNFANDTGRGSSGRVDVMGNATVLAGSVILADGSNDFNVNSVALMQAPSATTLDAPSQIVTRNNFTQTGSVTLMLPSVLGATVRTINTGSPTGAGGAIV